MKLVPRNESHVLLNRAVISKILEITIQGQRGKQWITEMDGPRILSVPGVSNHKQLPQGLIKLKSPRGFLLTYTVMSCTTRLLQTWERVTLPNNRTNSL